jgi:hypothetical protein
MENGTTAVAVLEPRELRQVSAQEIKQRINLVQEVMHEVMIEGVHYGIIEGTKEPTLYKPGAEILNVTFRLAPRFEITRTNLEGGHREYEIRTMLSHISTGEFWGEGVGSCSTMESKYRYRFASRICPNCEHDAISRSRQDYGGGWYCNQRKGGCGAKFDADDPAIIDQEAGRVENPDIADVYNTVLKMAKKRSHVDATLTATACSDIFKQTTEDEDEEPERPKQPPAQQRQQPQGGFRLITPTQIGVLMRDCKQYNVPEEDLKVYLSEKHNILSRKDIPASLFDTVLTWVKSQSQGQRTAK